jgi:hypothetical protein
MTPIDVNAALTRVADAISPGDGGGRAESAAGSRKKRARLRGGRREPASIWGGYTVCRWQIGISTSPGTPRRHLRGA